MSSHTSEFHKDNFTWYQSQTGILQMKLFWLSIQKLGCIQKPHWFGNRQTFSSDLDFLSKFQGPSVSTSLEMVQKLSLECFYSPVICWQHPDTTYDGFFWFFFLLFNTYISNTNNYQYYCCSWCQLCAYVCLPHFKMLELWNKYGFFSELRCSFVSSNNSSVDQVNTYLCVYVQFKVNVVLRQ